MQSTEQDPREMLGSYMRAQTSSAKELALRIGCDPRSAEGYRAGRYWPQAKHWPGIVAAFGRDVIEAVFFPDEAAARLQAEIHALEQDLAAKRRLARAAASARPANSNTPARLGPGVAGAPASPRPRS